MKREYAAAALSALLGAAIWALARPMTGKAEPWDANSAYYYVALVGAGLAAGLAIPARKRFHYGGVVLGQALYALLFLPASGLFPIGVLALCVYSLLFLAAVALALRVRSRPMPKEGAE